MGDIMKIWQVDSFTTKAFGGNPAAVVVLEEDIPDTLKQSIAAEMNISETAFVLWKDGPPEIRWFTPTTEVELCGHATLVELLPHGGASEGDSGGNVEPASAAIAANRLIVPGHHGPAPGEHTKSNRTGSARSDERCAAPADDSGCLPHHLLARPASVTRRNRRCRRLCCPAD